MTRDPYTTPVEARADAERVAALRVELDGLRLEAFLAAERLLGQVKCSPSGRRSGSVA